MKILFVLNGDFNEKLKTLLKKYDIIIAVDGGLNNLRKISLNYQPNYIIGDFDSIDKSILECYKNSRIIYKDNQDESDLLFSLKYITKYYKNIENIDIICSIGNRLDHTLFNLITLLSFDFKIKIIGLNEDIYFLKNNIKIDNVRDLTISILPLTNIKNMNSNGLKWEYKNVNLNFGFVNGISNIAINDNIELKIDSGSLLVFVNKII